MTSELRPAMEVADDCYEQEFFGIEAAAAVIEADREAVRAKVVGKIVEWLNDQDKSTDVRDAADQIQAKFGVRPARPEEYEGQL